MHGERKSRDHNITSFIYIACIHVYVHVHTLQLTVDPLAPAEPLTVMSYWKNKLTGIQALERERERERERECLRN